MRQYGASSHRTGEYYSGGGLVCGVSQSIAVRERGAQPQWVVFLWEPQSKPENEESKSAFQELKSDLQLSIEDEKFEEWSQEKDGSVLLKDEEWSQVPHEVWLLTLESHSTLNASSLAWRSATRAWMSADQSWSTRARLLLECEALE